MTDFNELRQAQREGEILGTLLALNNEIDDAVRGLLRALDMTIELRDLLSPPE